MRRLEDIMKVISYAAIGTLLLATTACGDWGNRNMNPSIPFDSQLRTSPAQPTTCSPADSTCGSGLGNPSVQSPVQKREQNISPQ
jgi:hypothetical protein